MSFELKRVLGGRVEYGTKNAEALQMSCINLVQVRLFMLV